MSEFKKGDRVRTVRDNPVLYYKGDTGKILCHRKEDDMYLVRFDDKDGILRESWLCEGRIELLKAKHPVIVITTDGVTTTATKRLGKKVLGTAYSKCAPADTFDYDTGVGLALARLCGFKIQIHEEEPQPPKKYTHKVVCVESAVNWWTVGKIYDCKNGVLHDDDGSERNRGSIYSIDNLNQMWWGYDDCREARFIELAED